MPQAEVSINRLAGQSLMKHKLGEKQIGMLLRRPANQIHLAPLLPNNGLQPKSSRGRVIWEALAGSLLGVPLGVCCYYIMLEAYYPVMVGLMLFSVKLCSSLHISARPMIKALDFGPAAVLSLAILALAAIFYGTRLAIRQGYRVFAWMQLPLTLITALALFSLTLASHKPLLPFYEQ